NSCTSAGAECGAVPDGCGQTLVCGSCADDEVCEANVCLSTSDGSDIPASAVGNCLHATGTCATDTGARPVGIIFHVADKDTIQPLRMLLNGSDAGIYETDMIFGNADTSATCTAPEFDRRIELTHGAGSLAYTSSSS